MRRYIRSVIFTFLFLLSTPLGLPVPMAGAQETAGTAAPEEKVVELPSPEEAQKRIDEIAKRLEELEKAVPSEAITAEDILQRRNALITLQNIYQRFITLEEKTANLDKELEELQKATDETGREELSQEPPFNLSFYDQYLDQLQALDQQQNSIKTSASLAETGLNAASKQAGEEDKKLRRLNEEKEKAGQDYPEKLAWEIDSARLEREIAAVTEDFQTVNLQNLKKSLTILELQRGHLQRTVTWIEANLFFDQEDLDRILTRNQEKIQAAQEEIRKISADRAATEKEHFRAQARLERTSTEQAALVAQASLEAVEAKRLLLQQRLEKAQLELSLPNMIQKIWTDRYQLLKEDVPTEDLWETEEEAENRHAQLRQTLVSAQQFQSAVQTRRANVREQLDTEGLSKEQSRYLRDTLQYIETMADVNLNLISLLIRTDNLNARLLNELESKIGTVQITKKVSAFGKQRILELWQAELWSSGEHGVTVGKLIIALLLVILGSLFSSRIARLVRHRLLVRFDLDVDVAESVERVLFYVLIIFFILSSLKTVNIPLTAFAFLGGAVAIGFGFGAQKFFSNLISGFLILAQKPFRINDVIQVDDTMASVKSVGSRYTRIQTFENLDLLVPNSYLLDNKIVNWTLSDKVIRQKISVGVGYDSDPHETERLLLKAVKEHVKVLPAPKPFVVFRDFGDNALIFDVLFWVNLDFKRSWFAASDIRYRIVELFRHEGIVIAFPQTDVHLDVNGPIELQFRDDGRSSDPRSSR